MSINRINRQSYINAYNSKMNKSIDKVNKAKDTDRIEISSIGKTITDYSLNTDVLNNAKKIKEIKAKIENGTYSVDARLTARSILEAMKESK